MTQRRVEAVERALTLLDAFSVQRPALSLTELAHATGFYKSTILRLMTSLERYGYAVRDGRGIYRVGPAVTRLAPLASEENPLERLIRPVLVTLRDATLETAAFHVREGGKRRCGLVEIGRHPVRHHLDEGAVMELGSAAADLALLDEEAAEQVFAGEDDGCAGLSSLAVAVRAPDGRLLGALTLSGASPRFVNEPDGALTAALLAQLEALEGHWPMGPDLA